jgi:hypothetical protein
VDFRLIVTRSTPVEFRLIVTRSFPVDFRLIVNLSTPVEFRLIVVVIVQVWQHRRCRLTSTLGIHHLHIGDVT